MGWTGVILTLLELFGPLIKVWLESLLTRAAAKLPDPDYDPAAVTQLFDQADKELWWFQFARRGLLARCKAMAEDRAEAVVTGTWVPPLTKDERRQLG